MDRDISLQMVTKLGNLNTALQALATNTIPETPAPAAASLSMAPLMTGSLDPEAVAPVEDSEVPQEETAEPDADPEPSTETTIRKKTTSK